jgi:hypothetical protein
VVDPEKTGTTTALKRNGLFFALQKLPFINP